MTTKAAEATDAPPALAIIDDGRELPSNLRAGQRAVWRWGRGHGPGAEHDARRFGGDPLDPSTYEWMRGARAVTAVVAAATQERALGIVQALRAVRDDAAVLILSGGIPDAPGDGTLVRPGALRDVLRLDVEEELERLEAERRVYCLRAFAGTEGVVPILVHPDPDPDAVSSATAVRALLERSDDEMPIVTLRAITRPENRRMADVLGVRAVEVTIDELRAFERIIAVDMQPTDLCGDDGPRLAVIDHHPVEHDCRADVQDVRSHLGATATMMTQYLRALDEERIHPALATALLFGIRTDTDGLTRKVTAEDVDAYAFLQERADLAMLRRFERPTFPIEAARAFGTAVANVAVQDDVAVAFAGELTPGTSHILADLGDFCMGIENVCWALAAGYVEGDLVVSVRHIGGTPGAGALARALADRDGNGGGHATMARFTVPGTHGRERFGRDVAPGLLRAAVSALDRIR